MKTVLYVDDSPEDLLLVRSAARLAGAQFMLVEATGGAEGIRYLAGQTESTDRARSTLPDFVLLDIKMPEIDGFAVLKWIRTNEKTRSLPVALFSASTLPTDLQRGQSEHADYFITKPAELKHLVEIIRTLDAYLSGSGHGFAGLRQLSELTPFSEEKTPC